MATWSTGARISESNHLRSSVLLLTAALHLSMSSIDLQLQQRRTINVDSSNRTAILTRFQASTYRFLIVQAVTQIRNISISYGTSLKYENHINGTSRGLLYMLKGGESSVSTYLASKNGELGCQVVVVPYLGKDPIPGGCCITCNFDNDPNLYIKKKSLMIQLMFQRANVYYDPGSKPESCDGGSFSTFTNLEYELYSYQLQENDFTDRFLYDGIWKMANAKNIKRYGHFVARITGTGHLRLLLQKIPREGIVYNILIRDSVEQTESAYVPTFAYDCDLDDIETCKSPGSIASIVYACLGCITGLVLCFLGHKIIKFELFIGGVITGFVVTYILILRLTTLTYAAHLISSTGVGVLIGLIILLLYLETKQFHTLFLNNALLIGSLIACSILFSPIVDLKTFSSNTVYILTFCAISFICPIPLSFFPKVTSLIFSSLIGGYLTVFACSIFMHANIQYIVIEFVLRAGIPSFADAYLRIPFQRNEFILCGVWGFLFIAGVTSQCYFTRHEDFPPKSKRGRRRSKSGRFSWWKRRRGTTKRIFDERTPLLNNENVEYRDEQVPENSTKCQQRRFPVNVNVV